MIWFLTQVSKLPWSILYFISDIFYLFVYKVAGYRTKVVRKNLSSSFPDKNEKELRQIERKFYHWLCDYFVETLKLLTITPEEMKKHLDIKGVELLEEAIRNNRNISAFLGHYCNWEWLSACKLFYPESCKEMEAGLIYHPLSNDTMDNLMLQARSQLGGLCINKKNILREIVRLKKEGRSYMFGYIFDQSPKWENMHLWLDFLNHDTPVFTGAERIARKCNDYVVYVHMQRPMRGKYVATFKLVSTSPADEPEGEPTRRAFAMLEKNILEAPHLYLWTHNRWKRTHEEYLKRMQKQEERKQEERRDNA